MKSDKSVFQFEKVNVLEFVLTLSMMCAFSKLIGWLRWLRVLLILEYNLGKDWKNFNESFFQVNSIWSNTT